MELLMWLFVAVWIVGSYGAAIVFAVLAGWLALRLLARAGIVW